MKRAESTTVGCAGFQSNLRADRREFLKIGSLGLGGLSLPQLLDDHFTNSQPVI
jgi:hypothetical protein